jgi:DNA recombination protein RmuC
MDFYAVLIGLLAGLLVGGIGIYLVLRLSLAKLEAATELEQKRASVENLVKPIADSLGAVGFQIQEMEKARKEAYGSLREQVRSLHGTQQSLTKETENLVRALRAPRVRGRWGEMQLKRVVELAGMLDHCDFVEQAVTGEEGRLRPDLSVNLPGGKKVVVDAKTPLEAYLNALEAEDEKARNSFLKDHARQVRDHITKLSAKAYWKQFEETPEFVVLFLPGEVFFSAALEQDPALIEEGVKRNVILATPTSLISLLRAVAYGWQQDKVTESAQKICCLGRELYDRIRNLTDHFTGVGKGLDRAVDSYNRAVGSLESRVLTAARKFTELEAFTHEEIKEPPAVEKRARVLRELEEV